LSLKGEIAYAHKGKESNGKTVKRCPNPGELQGVSFYGAQDEYVISGSDCGHIFVWRKQDGKLVRLLQVGSWT